MEDKWRINKIGDGWISIPKEVFEKKKEYEKLYNKIKTREKWILDYTKKIHDIKKELRGLKVKRTKNHHQMVKYHKKLTPSFTISLSKTKKLNRYLNSDSVKTRGNHSWTITPNIGGWREQIYLGSNKELTMFLDLIEGKDNLDNYYEMYPHEFPPHLDKIKNRINEIICPLIVSDMKRWLKKNETIDGWFEQGFKKGYLMNKLKRIYKNSVYYEVHQKNPELSKIVKSRFTVIQPNEKTGSTIYVEKKRWTDKRWEEYYKDKGDKVLEKKFRDKQKKRNNK